MTNFQFYFLAFGITFLDQLIKYLVTQLMRPSQTIPLIHQRLHLTYVQNTGAAFGLLKGQGFFLIGVGLLVIVTVIYFHHRISQKESLTQMALAFILGGSLGNLIDRFFRGYVVDFIDLRFWPVFNLADMAVNLGVIILLVQILMKPKSH